MVRDLILPTLSKSLAFFSAFMAGMCPAPASGSRFANASWSGMEDVSGPKAGWGKVQLFISAFRTCWNHHRALSTGSFTAAETGLRLRILRVKSMASCLELGKNEKQSGNNYSP